MKKGKALEQLVKGIQKTLSESSAVFVNERLVDVNGLKREFDVIVKSITPTDNGIIVFECKDFLTSCSKKKVNVGFVDALIGKCLDIPTIDQKIIVSTTGFTKGAIIKAKTHNIQLYNLDEVPYEKIVFVKKIYRIIPQISYSTISYHYNHSLPINWNNVSMDMKLYNCNDDCIADLSPYFKDFNELIARIFNLSVNKGLSTIKFKMCIEVNSLFYTKDFNDNKYLVSMIEIPLKVEFEQDKSEIVRQFDYFMDNSEAKTTEVSFQNEERTIVVIEAEGKDCFFLKKNEVLFEVNRL